MCHDSRDTYAVSESTCISTNERLGGEMYLTASGYAPKIHFSCAIMNLRHKFKASLASFTFYYLIEKSILAPTITKEFFDLTTTKEFFEIFWSELKNPFLSFVLHSFGKEELCTSQRQAIIKLIEKKKRQKIKD